MNITERAAWLARDLRVGLGLDLSDGGEFTMANILRVQFHQVERITRGTMRVFALLCAIGGFGAGVLFSVIYIISR